jgi:hypothetical protein
MQGISTAKSGTTSIPIDEMAGLFAPILGAESRGQPRTSQQVRSKKENPALGTAKQSAAPRRNAFDPGQAARQPAWTPSSAVVEVVNRLAAYEGSGQSRLCTG